MSTSTSGIARRAAVAILLVLLAAGSALAVSAVREPTSAPAAANPTASAAAKPDRSAKPEKSPEVEDNDATEESPEPGDAGDADGSPTAANLARIAERLAAAGISTTADQLATLAGDVGVGGAVRVLRFAKASSRTPSEILALFESGKGWGVIARELDLGVGPGNGSVMGRGNGLDKNAKAADKAARAASRAQQKSGSDD